MGTLPCESFTEDSLWWKHEKLHRRAMANFQSVGPEIRESFEKLEDAWFVQGISLVNARPSEKFEFMDDCWKEAERSTERWIADLERKNISFQHDGFRNMWQQFNAAASMPA